MIRATKVGKLSSAYDIAVDGRPVTRWEASVRRSAGTFTLGGHTYVFRRPSWWRNHFELVVDNRPVGFVRRASSWGTNVEAELPTLPPAAQVFTVGVALLTWAAADTAAVVAATS